jgi:hypothetical protein
MPNNIPDFTDIGLQTVAAALNERYFYTPRESTTTG